MEYGVFHGIRGIRVEYGRIQASGRSFGIRGKRIQTVGYRYFPGIPGFSRYTRKIPGIFADLADFGPKPASVLRLGSEPGKLSDL